MQNSEYEFQSFGFTAEQQSLERRHELRRILNDTLDNLIKKLTSSEETSRLLHAQKPLVSENILSSLEEDMKGLDELDRKCFTVPGHVLLESDFDYPKYRTEESEESLDKKYAELKQLSLENRVFVTLLEEEEEKFKLVKPYIDDQLEMCDQLKRNLNIINSDQSIVKAKDLIKKL